MSSRRAARQRTLTAEHNAAVYARSGGRRQVCQVCRAYGEQLDSRLLCRLCAQLNPAPLRPRYRATTWAGEVRVQKPP